MTNQRRSLKNTALTSRFRLQFLGWWLLLSFVQLALLGALIYLVYDQIRSSLAAYPEAAGNQTFISPEMMIFTLVASGIGIFAAIITLAIVTAHRIGGPYFAIRRTCQAIIEGDPHARLSFRTDDHLDDIAAEVNQMIDVLQQGDVSTSTEQHSEAA